MRDSKQADVWLSDAPTVSVFTPDPKYFLAWEAAQLQQYYLKQWQLSYR